MQHPDSTRYSQADDQARRSPSPTTQLPSLQERLLRNRQDEPPFSTRPFLRLDEDSTMVARSDSSSSNNTELDVAAAVAPQPSPSWSETSSNLSNPSPRDSSDTEAKRKRPRFLGDIDRRIIIQRLENGEKQADLAREFGVTRAAICHINKNREEILTRFDILAKSPQGRQMIENYVRSPHFASSVRELRTPSVSVLLTRLRDNATSSAAFKSTADRLMSILIEESLVSFGTKAIGVEDTLGSSYEGKEYSRQTVALSLGKDGWPLLNVFASMEPSFFRGFVQVEKSDGSLRLARLDLPNNASDANVLLFQVGLYDAEATAQALLVLQARGVSPSRVCVVCVTATADAVTALASRFRDVKVVTAVINADIDTPRLAGFVGRYTHAKSA